MGTLVVASAGADAQAQQVISQRDRTDKGVAFLWTGSRDNKTGLPRLKDARIPIFYTPDKLARGLQSRLAYHTWRERRLADGFATAPPRTASQDQAIAQALGLGRPTLSESESKQLLAAWGAASAREHLANSADEAVAAAEQLGFPVALKVDSPDILHKTEAGVVRLNLGDAAQVRTAYAEVVANAKAHAPQARIIGASVQEMVRDGVEVIVGVSCDPQLGPVLLFGSGGVMVEVYNDVALRRCPITRSEAQAMIAEVKGARLLHGFRGRPAADIAALADTLVHVSHLATQLEGHLAELDINPLMVLPSGQGVKAVDGLVVLRGV
jgi:acyl-CoA synthetase (NDP forming)